MSLILSWMTTYFEANTQILEDPLLMQKLALRETLVTIPLIIPNLFLAIHHHDAINPLNHSKVADHIALNPAILPVTKKTQALSNQPRLGSMDHIKTTPFRANQPNALDPLAAHLYL